MRITLSDFEDGRSVCRSRLSAVDPNGQAALLLSGGIDSVTVLFSMLSTGRKPDCFTFAMDGNDSADLRSSVSLCRKFGLKHHVVRIPALLESILEDTRWTIAKIDWTRTTDIKKTIVQCVHPFRHVGPVLPPLTLCGLGGDSFYLTRRQERMAARDLGDAAVSKWRRSFASDPDYSDFHIMDTCRRAHGKTIIDFYDDPGWTAWIRRFPLSATHRPIEKYASVGLWPDYWSQGKFLRQQSSFQVNSGLRDRHDLLLKGTPHKAIIALYRQMARDLGVRIGGNLPRRDPDGRLLDDRGYVIGEPS
jgi:hypothetical protein